MEQEKQWIKKIRAKGDKGAAESLVSRYYREIYAFVYRQMNDKELAMDLTQEIFVAALKTIGGYDEKKGAFRTWLYRVAANKTVDYFRSRAYKAAARTSGVDVVFAYESDERDLAEVFEQREDAKEILDRMATLELSVQRILRLKIFSCFTFAEIAKILVLPESTVKTRYYAAVRQIRKGLKGGALA